MLNNKLLFGYALQVLMRHKLRTYSSSVCCLTPSTPFILCGSNSNQCIHQFWNFTSVCRFLENLLMCGSDEWLNVTNLSIRFNGKFASAGSPTHPKPLHKNVSEAFLSQKSNRKRTVTFPRAIPWGLRNGLILDGSSAQAGFPLTSIVSYGSQVCGWEGWRRGGLCGL